MRTTERLRKLKIWIEKNLCEGREMKAPAPGMKIDQIIRREPTVYMGWAPDKIDSVNGFISENAQDVSNVCPCIIVMPNQTYAKYMEERRFDRYNNVHRPSMMGQHLAVSILFCLYEPGTRLPGFVESIGEKGKGTDVSLLLEGTETGFYALLDWMDDCIECLLRDRVIPNTDLWVQEDTITYSLYTDQSYIVDKRPLYYGFVNVVFGGHADEGHNSKIQDLLS
jgi:hypothetical protein